MASRQKVVSLFSAVVLAAFVIVTQNGGAFASSSGGRRAATGGTAQEQEPTAGNTKTPGGEKPKVITDAVIPDEDADEGEFEPAAVTMDVCRRRR